jgi:hypothetical protein
VQKASLWKRSKGCSRRCRSHTPQPFHNLFSVCAALSPSHTVTQLEEENAKATAPCSSCLASIVFTADLAAAAAVLLPNRCWSPSDRSSCPFDSLFCPRHFRRLFFARLCCSWSRARSVVLATRFNELVRQLPSLLIPF